MRGCVPAVLGLVLALSWTEWAWSQDRPAAKEAATSRKGESWWSRWWPFAGKGEDKQSSAAPSALAVPPMESAATIRARELAALQRRQAVCLRLRQVAIEIGDDRLAQKADELDQLAWHIYEQRTRAAVSRPVHDDGRDQREPIREENR